LQAIILYSVSETFLNAANNNLWEAINLFYSDQQFLKVKSETKLLLVLQMFTITAWVVSFLGLFFAFCTYIPLVTLSIRGNLKEYCVHKVDKRY
jgi:hypothetical protein